MISLIAYGVYSTAVVLGLFYYFNGYTIVTTKWKNLKRINALVSSNYTGTFKISYITMCIITKALWMSCIEYNNTAVKLDGNKYLVSYTIKGVVYKMIIKPRKGPSKVVSVFDESGLEISNLLFPYLGLDEKFHGGIYTPLFFQKTELVFELLDGTTKTFKENETIIL